MNKCVLGYFNFIPIVFEISGFVHDFQGQREVKSEREFDTVATESCSVANRMFEHLNPLNS